MKTNPIRRAVSLVAGAALLLPALAVPASAAPSQAKATATLSVDDRLVLARSGKNLAGDPYNLTVKNTGTPGLAVLGGGDPAINYIQVVVPAWHTDLTSVADPDGAGPWVASVDDENNVVILSGGSLAPGGSLEVAFGGTVANDLENDDYGIFRTSVSENGGQSLAKVAQDPRVDIDVLEALDISATGPVGKIDYTDAQGNAATFEYSAADGTVSAKQSNVDLAVNVNNLSTVTKSVTTTLKGVVGEKTVSVSSGLVGTAEFTDVVFGNAGTVKVDADLTAPGADRSGARQPLDVTVQQAVSFTKSAGISPAFFGAGQKTFEFSLSKAGAPAALVDVELSFVGKDNSALRAPSKTVNDRFVAKDSGTLALSVPLNWDAALHDDGVFNARAKVSGTDANGAEFTLSPIELGEVTFDSLIPSIKTLTLTAPAAKVGSGKVATNGSTLNFAGTAIDPTSTNAEAPCKGCTVKLKLTDGITDFVTRDVTADANGAFSGTMTVADYKRPRDTFEIKLTGAVTDAAGNPSADVSSSNLVEVDTLPPAVFRIGNGPEGKWDQGAAESGTYVGDAPNGRVKALTGGETENDPRLVDVVFDELIGGSTTAIQWFVDSNGENYPVQSAEIIDNTKVRLTLTRALGVNARAVVNHDPTLAGPDQRIFDRAGQRLIAGLVNTIDNIIPDPTKVLTVDGQGLYKPTTGSVDAFYTNLSTYNEQDVKVANDNIVFTAERVPAGTTLNLQVRAGTGEPKRVTYENTTGSDQTSVEIVRPIAALFGSSVSDATYTLEAFISDTGANTSDILSWPLVIDRADPNAKSAKLGAGNDLVVTATEALRSGRMFASDWLVNVTNRNRAESFPVSEVVLVSGDNASRSLVVDNSYDLKSANVTVKDGEYVFRGTANQRFVDAAGNRLAKGSVFTFGS